MRIFDAVSRFNADASLMIRMAFDTLEDQRECAIVGRGRGGTTIVETRIAVSDTEQLVNGGRRFKLTSKMLDQMVANYSAWIAEGGAPAPGYFGHPMSEEHAKARAAGQEDPALYVMGIRRDGEELMGTIEFMPWAWSRVWAEGALQWRGLSILFAEEANDRNGKSQGATFFGVDIVPDPLLPAQIAAAKMWPAGADARGEPVSVLHLSYRVAFLSGPGDHGSASGKVQPNDGAGNEDPMAEENVVKALLAEKDSKIETLTRENATLKDQLVKKDEDLKLAKKETEDAKTALSKDKDDRAKVEKEQAGKDAQEAITLALNTPRADGKPILIKANVEGYEKSGDAALACLERINQTAKGLRFACSCLGDGGKSHVARLGRTAPAGAPETGGDEDGGDPTQSIHEEATQMASKEKISYSEALDRIRAKDPKRFEAARAQTPVIRS